MKKNYLLIICNLLLITLLLSCKGNESIPEKVQKGTYTIEKYVHAIKKEKDSRGFDDYNQDFDSKYDPNVIYLHNEFNQSVEIPLFITDCGTETECKCFRYKIVIYEDGHAEVTPIIDKEGTLASESLPIPVGSNCFFSSERNKIWEMRKEQIIPKPENNHIFYNTNTETNKEIYRSEGNFATSDLINNINDLIMVRACAGFTLAGILYDSEATEYRGQIILEEEVFKGVMQSNPEDWYIKIYMGGNSLVTKFNIMTMNQEGETTEYDHGYYSTGVFSKTNNNNRFNQFGEAQIGHGKYFYYGYGYYTPIESSILVPTLKKELDIYVLIKKWEGTNPPDEEWLSSDKDAVYTKLTLAVHRQPENGYFYILCLLMDVREFYEIWQQRQNLNNTPSPASRTANGMHYFELKNAKVIVEKY